VLLGVTGIICLIVWAWQIKRLLGQAVQDPEGLWMTIIMAVAALPLPE